MVYKGHEDYLQMRYMCNCVTVSLVEHVSHLGNILHFGKGSCSKASRSGTHILFFKPQSIQTNYFLLSKQL